MSRASKQVDWCIVKAKKELDECKKQEKRPRHRGLVKSVPNLEISKKHLEKAEHDFRAINYLLKGNFEDVSISMIFYSMYHCMLAIAAKFGFVIFVYAITLAIPPDRLTQANHDEIFLTCARHNVMWHWI
jgi:hypothetical protein